MRNNYIRVTLASIVVCWMNFEVSATEFDVSAVHPYGLPNPGAPVELAQFAFIVGQNDCSESRRNPASGDWIQSDRTWDAHYVLNGYGIYDTGGSGNATNGNMRIFDKAKGLWHVTFFASPVYSSGTWTGGKVGDRIVLKKPQVAPVNNIPGFSTLTFSNISDNGFDWSGEWVSEDGKITYPFWTITCKKRSVPR